MNTLEQPEAILKPGRQRIYSNEQRKDRNRKAQAAFRDRRSNYTKTLEVALLKYEEKFQDLEKFRTSSLQQVKRAEERCDRLNAEVASLQNLLQLAIAENQRLLHGTNLSLPVSPGFSTRSTLSVPDFMLLLDEPRDFFDTKWLEDLNQNSGQIIGPRPGSQGSL